MPSWVVHSLELGRQQVLAVADKVQHRMAEPLAAAARIADDHRAVGVLVVRTRVVSAAGIHRRPVAQAAVGCNLHHDAVDSSGDHHLHRILSTQGG